MLACGGCLHQRAAQTGPASCSRGRRHRTATAAQFNNGPNSTYRPRSKAARISTAPDPRFNPSSVADSASSPQLRQWIKTPFDLLALGPRATLGALLNAAEIAQSLPAEVEKLQILAQDPRPFQDKQAVLAQEVQATVASLVERGVLAESEVVALLKQVLPDQLQQLIPEQLGNVAPQSPAVVQQQAQETAYEEPPLSAEQLSLSQTGEELLQLKTAVTGVKEALADLRANTDPARAAVIKLNVRDARDSLRRRLSQISPETLSIQGAPVSAAKSEAGTLLAEVDVVLRA